MSRDPGMVSVRDAARMCGVSEQTIRRWIKDGIFAGAEKGLGRSSPYKIPRSEVERVVAGKSQDLSSAVELPREVKERAAQQGGYVALVVEDNPDVCHIYQFALGRIGIDTVVVTSVESARVWLDSMTPDLVVLDLHLPFASGSEVLGHMRANEELAGVPVIVATAYPHDAEGLEDQVAEILVKPIRIEVLQELAQKLIAGAREM